VQEVVREHRGPGGGVTLRATASGVAPDAVPALEQALHEAAARHGARLEVSSAAAADLEAVLLDLMDRDAPGVEDAGSTTHHDDAPSAGAAR